jgi:hypothetical protein
MKQSSPQVIDYKNDEWLGFPGGELEGKRPRRLCVDCRAALQAAATSGTGEAGRKPLCFQCYRAEVERERSLKAAGELNTASVERFQSALPFEPVNVPRLEMLKAERVVARTTSGEGMGRFEDRRRRAQIAARHALQQIVATLSGRQMSPALRTREIAAVTHAAELQLPESWIPFVVSR